MAIVLLILKIIGIILLSILTLTLVILLLLLFDPVHFNVKLSYYDKANGYLKVHWLFRIFGCHYWFDDGSLNGYWRFFGKKHYLNGEEKAKSTKKDKAKPKKNNNKSETILTHYEEEQYTDVEVEEIDHMSNSDTKAEENKQNTTDNKKLKKSKTNKGKNRKRNKPGKKKGFIRIKEFISNIIGMIKKIKDIFTNESYQMAVKRLVREAFVLLKHVLPKKMKLKMEYSCGSPDITALVLGGISCFPIAFQNEWNIHSDFEAEKAYVKGETSCKGRLVPFILIRAVLRIIVDKNCRKLYNDFND